MNGPAPYRLRDGLSYCILDGHPIFLDVYSDRYFRLSTELEQSFISYEAGDRAEGNVGALLGCRLLTQAPDEPSSELSYCIDAPRRSAIEQACSTRAVRPVTLLEVIALVCSTQAQLKTHSLKAILEDVVALRRKSTSSTSTAHSDQSLLRATSAFGLARKYVPLATTCLLDSLALMKFLARRHLHANLVFGVTNDPFTAHCWVQAGDLALNETVGDATARTPIRVV